MVKQPRIMAVKALPGYVVELRFTSGEIGKVNLRDWIVGRGGVFTPLEDMAYFATVGVNLELGTIQWPNGVDFCPDVLYSLATGKPLPFCTPTQAIA